MVSWFGGALLFTTVVTPTLQKLEPSSRIDFIKKVLPRFLKFIGASSGGAVLAGIALYVYVNGFVVSLAPDSSGLIFIQVGAILGLIAFLIAMVVVIPTGRKLVASLSDAKPPPPERVARLQARLRMGASAAAGILLVTLILMVAGTIL